MASLGKFVLACCVLLATQVVAEHRTAVLVGKDAEQLQVVADGLEQMGFYCRQVATPQGQRSVKNLLEGFARTTPTHGTALVYFQGDVSESTSNGTSSIHLLPSEARGRGGFAVELLCEALVTRGGSTRNLVIIDAPKLQEPPQQLPDGCLVTFAKTNDWLPQVNASKDLLALLQQAGNTRMTLSEGGKLTGRGTPRAASPDTFVQGKRAGDEWFNHRGMVFCWCPAGRYVAGSPKDEPRRHPDEAQRQVVINSGFWISKYELTRTQNLRDRNGNAPPKSIARHKLDPLTMVNLDDAKNMTRRQFTADERKSGRLPADWEYNLPVETQWEYAARAGTQTAYSFGDAPQQLPAYGNFADRTFYETGDVYANYAHRVWVDGVARLAQVGSYQPNAWGLHDMHGNVAEWCLSTAVRGGSWVNTATDCRAAYRHHYSSRNEQNYIGYRIVIQKVPPSEPRSK